MTTTQPPHHRSARLLTGLGIALPVVMMLCFVAYASWQRSSVPMPRHALLVMEPSWNQVEGLNGVRYVVENERVIAYPSLELSVSYQLYRVDPVTLDVEPIEISFESLPLAGPTPVAALADVRVSSKQIAPDGYRMTDGYRDGPGFIGELFGRRRHGDIGFSRDGVVHWADARGSSLSHWNAVFVGWVVSGDSLDD